MRYLRPGTCQMPDKSGWPLAFRGVAADMFALPFGSRGMPALGWSCHCAASGIGSAHPRTSAAARFVFTFSSMTHDRHGGYCNRAAHAADTRFAHIECGTWLTRLRSTSLR